MQQSVSGAECIRGAVVPAGPGSTQRGLSLNSADYHTPATSGEGSCRSGGATASSFIDEITSTFLVVNHFTNGFGLKQS